MKRFIAVLMAAVMLFSVCAAVSAEEAPAWREFYVSVDGNDENPGTADAPFKTIKRAQEAVREINRGMQGDIVVNIQSGTYYLDEQLEFFTDDSGFNGHRVIYRGLGDSKPVISGGRRVTGFTKSEYEGIYVAPYDADVVLQLTVNDQKRYVAKTADYVVASKRPENRNTAEWYAQNPKDTKDDAYNYHDPDSGFTFSGMYISKKYAGIFDNADDVLCLWNRSFITSYVPVTNIMENPDNADEVIFEMEPALWNYCRKAGLTGSYYPDPQRDFTILNAFELLDEPGEFYYNKKTKLLYYMPTADEDMSTANVVVPTLEYLVVMDGNDVDDKITNITFENLQFSDSSYDYSLGYRSWQARSIPVKNGSAMEAPVAILVQRADGLKFENNIISRTGAAAIDYYNGVTNSTIIGNAIFDIGEQGICVGAGNHGDYALGSVTESAEQVEKQAPETDGVSNPVPDKYKDAPYDIVGDQWTKITCSYMGQYNTTYSTAMSMECVFWPGRSAPDDVDWDPTLYKVIHQNYVDEKYEYVGLWRDDYSKTKGEKPYMKFEFIRPYTIDQISVSFDKTQVKPGENADFEVLVSNDKNFSEGNYKVVATQNGTAPSDVNHYKLGDGVKYKYVMIRKLTADDFAMSRVWVETTDRKPYVKNQRCNNLRIENNLLKRIATESGRSIGIFVTHADDTTILHNEVIDCAYSGISIGFSWNPYRPTSHNIDLGYNYVFDAGQTNHDGGGIYSLGPQPGTRIHHNFVEYVNVGTKAMYTDNGSRYLMIEENLFGNTMHMLSPYHQNIMENTYRNNYGTHPYSKDDKKEQNDYEEVERYVLGQPEREMYDTYVNAGLQTNYEYLHDLVPEGANNMYFGVRNHDVALRSEKGAEYAEACETVFIDALTYTYENAEFGTGLGMYPLEWKDRLSNALTIANDGNNPDTTMTVQNARFLEIEMRQAMNRYSLSDTIKLCEEALAAADKTKYPETSIQKFEKVLNTQKAIKITSPEIEYDVLTALEAAYNEFDAVRYSDKIHYVSVPDMVKCEINDEEKTVTLVLKPTAEQKIDSKKMTITTDGSAKIARIISGTLNLENGIKVPVYNKGTKKYTTWTIKSTLQEEKISSVITPDDWTMNCPETNKIRYASDGVVLPAGPYAHMATVNGGEQETTLTFKPNTQNPMKEMTVILGADSPYNFDVDSKAEEFNHCRVVFEDNKATFYKVSDGKMTKIDSTTTSGIKWNEKNELKYEVKVIQGNTHIKVNLNGKLIFSEVIKKCSYGRYAGIYTPYMNVKIY